MSSWQEALQQARLLHKAFLANIFLLIFAVHAVAPDERPVPPPLVVAAGCLAVAGIAAGFLLRKLYLNRAEQALVVESDAGKALAAWRTANLLSFAQAEAVALFGLALKALGAGWKTAGPFFFVGFALLLLWTPRLDLPVSPPPSPPPPAP